MVSTQATIGLVILPQTLFAKSTYRIVKFVITPETSPVRNNESLSAALIALFDACLFPIKGIVIVQLLVHCLNQDRFDMV